MPVACVLFYSWIPTQLTWLAFCAFLALALRYRWSGTPALGLPLLALLLWQGRPGAIYYWLYGLLLLAFRLHWRRANPASSLAPRAASYVLAGYLGYVGLPALLGVPPQIAQWCTMCPSNQADLTAAINGFKDERKRLPHNLEELVPTYLSKLPSCHQLNPAGRVFYSQVLEIHDSYRYQRLPGESFRIWCPNRGLAGHQAERQ
ncbi:MAG: hypothetical protein U0931_31240 [Vulcanimicrobiota bacterium]